MENAILPVIFIPSQQLFVINRIINSEMENSTVGTGAPTILLIDHSTNWLIGQPTANHTQDYLAA
jgi:hypothetical protein